MVRAAAHARAVALIDRRLPEVLQALLDARELLPQPFEVRAFAIKGLLMLLC